MADSMALPRWSAQLASSRPLSCNSSRPSRVWEIISMGSDSVDGFATEQQFRRDDDAAQSGGSSIETILHLFDQFERDARPRLAPQHTNRDFAPRHTPPGKNARNGHESAGPCL